MDQLQRQLLAEGKNGTGVSRTVASGAGRGRRRPALDDVCRVDGCPYVHRPSDCDDALQAGTGGPKPRSSRVGRDGNPIPVARSHVRGASRFRRSQVRHVASDAGPATSSSFVGCAANRTDQHGRHRSRCLSISWAKRRWAETISLEFPTGFPSLQDRVNLLYTYGVSTGRLDPCRFVDIASTQAARLFGLFPRKGTIQPGADADW